MEKEKFKIRVSSRFDLKGVGLFIILIILSVILGILSPYFFSINNIFNILLSIAVIGIAAVGMTLVIISGGLDLSVEPIIACTSVIIALLNLQNIPIYLTILVGLAVGPIFGFINGIIITKGKVNSVITTLATMSIIRGIALLLTDAKTVRLKNEFIEFIARGRLFGKIPIVVIIMISIFIIFYFILNNTAFGRNVYAVGGNPEASRLAGINIDKNKIIIYMISGALASVSGLIFAAITAAGLPSGANGYALSIIAAVVLGGTSLSGGSGRIQGTILGILIIGVLNNGLVLLNVQTFWQMIVTGIVLILAVLLDKINLRSK